MTHHTITPAGAVTRGLLAGAAGTAVMTGCQLAMMKIQGGSSSTVPGQVAQRVGEGVLHRSVPDSQLGMLTQVVHWSYGTAWGAAYGIMQSSLHWPTPVGGTLFGMTNWSAGSLAALPVMGFAPPVTQRPATSNAIEAAFHLVYGLGVAFAYRAVTPRGH